MYVIILEKHWFIDQIGKVPRIKGLSREQGASRWKVSANNDSTCKQKNFSDSTYGGPAGSYKAALFYILANGNLYTQGKRKSIDERKDKVITINVPGVCISAHNGTDAVSYSIRLSPMAEQSGRYIRIGPVYHDSHLAFTYLRKAIQYRKEMEGHYARKRKVFIKDALPKKFVDLV